MLLAATLLITACTKPVDNEEIEDVNDQTPEEQVEENIDEEEELTEDEPNQDNEKEEKPNKDQENNNNGSNDKATNDQDTQTDNNQGNGNTEPKDNEQQTDRDPNELLTEQEAIAKVKSYLQLQFEPDVHVVVDHEENGRYLVHVYEVIPGNGGVGHTSTRGWYYVDRKTGEIESMF